MVGWLFDSWFESSGDYADLSIGIPYKCTKHYIYENKLNLLRNTGGEFVGIEFDRGIRKLCAEDAKILQN